MKHRLRDFLILLISISGLAWLYRWWCRRRGPLVRVLCFHDVPDPLWFESVLEALQAEFHILSPDAFHRRQFHDSKINILLTFDDGYQSWFDVALPLLNKHNCQALFFVSSGLLDAAEAGDEAVAHFVLDRLKLTTSRQLLTWAGARQLVAAQHTIGGHTVTHPSLAALEKEAAQQEIVNDKQALETNLKINLHDFAFPFGTRNDYQASHFELVQEAGYTAAYTTQSRFYPVQPSDVIPRTCVEYMQTTRQIVRWVRGSYDILQLCLKK